jgi:hypothetical protein
MGKDKEVSMHRVMVMSQRVVRIRASCLLDWQQFPAVGDDVEVEDSCSSLPDASRQRATLILKPSSTTFNVTVFSVDIVRP